jgi:predicted TIM-barrel fold metal-dependent hydrolase
MLDLSAIPIVDQHAHNLVRPEVELPYSAAFTEAYDPEIATGHVKDTLCLRRSVREIAALLGCPPRLDAVEAARRQLGFDELVRQCFAASGIATLLLDDGFLPDQILPTAWHARVARVYRLVRVEYLTERLIGETTSWADFQERFRGALRNLPADVVGLKSVVAYRTGLAVDDPDDAAAAKSFAVLRRRVAAGQHVRLAMKPLNDWVVRATLTEAAQNGRPVQFHTGFGDPDLDLRLANPLHLRPLFEDSSLRGVPIVLLHAGYPFTREAGYLAAVYPNAFVDLGLAIPLLSIAGMAGVVRACLELMPFSKLLFSTDAHVIPDLYYLGALWGRRALAAELDRAVQDSDLTPDEADEAAALILGGNARKLYGIGG